MLDPQQEKTWQIRQTSLVIDLAKLRARFAQLASIGPEVLVVLKSDGYGLGMPKVAHALETDPNNKNLHGFGVANVEEGIALRKAHIQKPIYVLSGIQHMDQEHYSCLQSYSLTPVISSLAVLQETVTFLRRNSLPLSIHLKFNTGMNRLGLDVSEISDAISLLQKHKSLRLDGLLSHYAAADKPKHILTKSYAADGLNCKRCQEYFAMSESNNDDGSFTCRSCRLNPWI
jgi:alanine racemase